MVTIEREIRNGRVQLDDGTIATECATCGAGEPIGCSVSIAGAADPLEFGICGDCLVEALAILWGRRHVQAGGDVGDLTFDAETRRDDRRPETRPEGPIDA